MPRSATNGVHVLLLTGKQALRGAVRDLLGDWHA